MDLSVSFPDRRVASVYEAGFCLPTPRASIAVSSFDRVSRVDGVHAVTIKGNESFFGNTRPRFGIAECYSPRQAVAAIHTDLAVRPSSTTIEFRLSTAAKGHVAAFTAPIANTFTRKITPRADGHAPTAGNGDAHGHGSAAADGGASGNGHNNGERALPRNANVWAPSQRPLREWPTTSRALQALSIKRQYHPLYESGEVVVRGFGLERANLS